MARIRTIKPEFPQSESIGRISREARLLFIMLWTIVDDEGRTRASSRMLASLLYPYDDDARVLIDGWLSELEAAGKVRRYEVDGSTYLDIPKWLEHQKIDRPSTSRLPPFDEGSRGLANDREASTTDLGPRTLDQDHSEPTGSAAVAAPVEVMEPTQAELEREFYRRGKQVCGKNAGGMLTSLLKARQYDVALARSVIELAATKQDPREFVGGAIRAGPRQSGYAPRPGSKDDTRERTVNALRQLTEYVDADDTGRGWETGEDAPGLLRLSQSPRS